MNKTNCVKITNQLKRIKGQLNGIEKMIESERSATEIVQQITAVRAALSRLCVDILKEESQECLQGKTRQKKQVSFEEIVNNLFKIV